jgi:energy-coupling factor transporter ATP-binding protein EcfA2
VKDEFLIEGLPAPGEPLKPEVSPENKALIEADLSERLEMIRSKLSKREKARLERRYARLQRQLKRARYNDLVARRWELYGQYNDLAEALGRDGADIEAIKANGRAVALEGQTLNEQIAALEPIADEYRLIQSRLKAHNDVLRWEAQEVENRNAFYREKRTWEEQIKSVFRQSPRLHYMGKNKKGKDVLKIPRIDHAFVKGDSVYYRIKTSAQNPIERLLGKWHSALPYGVDIESLTRQETLDNLSAACDRIVQVERGSKGMNLFYKINRLDATDGIPNRILYGKVMEWYPDELHHETPWAAGVTKDRRVEWLTFEKHPHILIAGASGGGKSNLLNAIIATLISVNSPDELRMFLVDNKGGVEFTFWEGAPHIIGEMIKDETHVLDALQNVVRIIKRRLAAFERLKAKKLSDFNARVKPEDRLPRIIVAIDEMATLLGLEDTADIQQALRVISAQGRAVGVHLIICTQHVSVDVIPGPIKTNMNVRVSGKMPSDIASRVILDTGTAALLPAVPGRMVISLGRIEMITQTPFISDNDIAKAVSISKEFSAPNNAEFTDAQPIRAREKFSREDLIALSLSDFGGSLAASVIHEALGNEVIPLRKLRELVQSVIAEGRVTWNGESYKLKKYKNAYSLVPDQPSTELKKVLIQ